MNEDRINEIEAEIEQLRAELDSTDDQLLASGIVMEITELEIERDDLEHLIRMGEEEENDVEYEYWGGWDEEDEDEDYWEEDEEDDWEEDEEDEEDEY